MTIIDREDEDACAAVRLLINHMVYVLIVDVSFTVRLRCVPCQPILYGTSNMVSLYDCQLVHAAASNLHGHNTASTQYSAAEL